MALKRKIFLTLSFFTLCYAVGAMSIVRYWDNMPSFKVKSIRVLPSTEYYNIGANYSSKVEVIVESTGKPAPQKNNGVMVAGAIVCRNARLKLSQTGAIKTLSQRPKVHVSVGRPENASTITFFFDKADLPLGEVNLEGVIQMRSTYNIHESNRVRSEEYVVAVIPVRVRVQ